MEQIFSRELQFNRGAEAARQNKPRESHGMNPGSAAIADWQEGHDYVTNARTKVQRAGAAMGARP